MTYRHELPELPDRMRFLPLDKRGYPVPWFVAWINGEPDFRIVDPRKFAMALKMRRCWVCGDRLGAYLAFVIGPMCAVNRVSSEPASHRECAVYSATACPFLTRPHMRRRDAGLPDVKINPPAGIGLDRNPGVSLVWITRRYRLQKVHAEEGVEKGWLVHLGEPRGVLLVGKERPRPELGRPLQRHAVLRLARPGPLQIRVAPGRARHPVRRTPRLAGRCRRLTGRARSAPSPNGDILPMRQSLPQHSIA